MFEACFIGDEATALHMIATSPEDMVILRNKESLFSVAHRCGCARVQAQIFKYSSKECPQQLGSFVQLMFAEPRLEAFATVLAASDEVALQQHQGKIPKPAKATGTSSSTISEAVNVLNQSNGGQGNLFAGRLHKKRGTNDWKPRWCIVTASDILYFAQASDSIPKGAVPLAGCTIRRYPDEPNTFEVLAPNIVTKKTFFGTEKVKAMLFRANDEREYFEWLFVLRAVTGSIPALRDNLSGALIHQKNRKELFGSNLLAEQVDRISSDVNSVASNYWMELSKNSLSSPEWTNCSFTKSILFLPGYTFCRLSFLQHVLVDASSRLNTRILYLFIISTNTILFLLLLL